MKKICEAALNACENENTKTMGINELISSGFRDAFQKYMEGHEALLKMSFTLIERQWKFMDEDKKYINQLEKQ